tara:strand:- start:787 stop:1299 length:513 start_codon:yes stop_codon:yes gene_type:complete
MTAELEKILIYDFKTSNPVVDWYVVNDNVMGGFSKGLIKKNKVGNGIFSGKISLFNNGGFSSVRYNFENIVVSASDTLIFHVYGDNKDYQLRVKQSKYDRHVYTKKAFIKKGWHFLKVPLNEMGASFRGRRLRMNNFDKSYISEIGILLGNKVEESFNLKIDSIYIKRNQ